MCRFPSVVFWLIKRKPTRALYLQCWSAFLTPSFYGVHTCLKLSAQAPTGQCFMECTALRQICTGCWCLPAFRRATLTDDLSEVNPLAVSYPPQNNKSIPKQSTPGENNSDTNSTRLACALKSVQAWAHAVTTWHLSNVVPIGPTLRIHNTLVRLSLLPPANCAAP